MISMRNRLSKIDDDGCISDTLDKNLHKKVQHDLEYALYNLPILSHAALWFDHIGESKEISDRWPKLSFIFSQL